MGIKRHVGLPDSGYIENPQYQAVSSCERLQRHANPLIRRVYDELFLAYFQE